MDDAPDYTPEPGTAGLAAALATVQEQLPRIVKDEEGVIPGKDGKSGYRYTYADLAQVSAAVLPLLGKHGLAFTAFPTMDPAGRFVLRYHLLHDSGESLTGDYPLPTGNPQQVGSAITYARRYCLCAVTGVAPDDDDGAAASHTEQQNTVEQVDNERAAAIGAVQGCWTAQYGDWDPAAAGRAFHEWSGGEDVRSAPNGRLKSFAAYLSALPPQDAGSDPDEARPPDSMPADTPASSGPAPARPAPMTGAQKGMLFALLGQLGYKAEDRQARLEYLSRLIGRPVASSSDLTKDEAKASIDALNKALADIERTGEKPS